MDSIKKLTDLFAEFPTVGRRTATRFVYYLVNLPKGNVDELIRAIGQVKNQVKLCDSCFQPHETSNSLCAICADKLRDNKTLCVVEKESDLTAVESAKKYKGLYFVLGGTLTTRNSSGENLRLRELKERVSNANFSEVILALNPTPEGRATSLLVKRALKELPRFSSKITHLAQGLPVGGELEYADPETLDSAFQGRK